MIVELKLYFSITKYAKYLCLLALTKKSKIGQIIDEIISEINMSKIRQQFVDI